MGWEGRGAGEQGPLSLSLTIILSTEHEVAVVGDNLKFLVPNTGDAGDGGDRDEPLGVGILGQGVGDTLLMSVSNGAVSAPGSQCSSSSVQETLSLIPSTQPWLLSGILTLGTATSLSWDAQREPALQGQLLCHLLIPNPQIHLLHPPFHCQNSGGSQCQASPSASGRCRTWEGTRGTHWRGCP